MLGLNSLFVWTEFFPQYAPNASAWVYNGLESIRVPLTIVELIAIGTLFVDLVVRFDQINKRLRAENTNDNPLIIILDIGLIRDK